MSVLSLALQHTQPLAGCALLGWKKTPASLVQPRDRESQCAEPHECRGLPDVGLRRLWRVTEETNSVSGDLPHAKHRARCRKYPHPPNPACPCHRREHSEWWSDRPMGAQPESSFNLNSGLSDDQSPCSDHNNAALTRCFH